MAFLLPSRARPAPPVEDTGWIHTSTPICFSLVKSSTPSAHTNTLFTMRLPLWIPTRFCQPSIAARLSIRTSLPTAPTGRFEWENKSDDSFLIVPPVPNGPTFFPHLPASGGKLQLRDKGVEAWICFLSVSIFHRRHTQHNIGKLQRNNTPQERKTNESTNVNNKWKLKTSHFHKLHRSRNSP